MNKKETDQYNFFPYDLNKLIKEIGKDKLLEALKKMLLIRNFETRAEAAYQQGKVGGFFHSYIGQEAIQTGCISALGNKHWFTTTYRCHALALLLGVTPNEIMAELYGKVTGNALGRGGSMHLYSDRLLGGFGIVGGHVPVAIGAAFSLKYLEQKDLISICFLGDGAVAQGAFHESMNLASLWDLPCLIVIENNQWGMGTAVERAIAVKPMAEKLAPAYGMNGYTFQGMDFFSCYNGFNQCYQEIMRTKKPILVEVITERFKGHSVSDPAFYRSKESLAKSMEKDPILFLKNTLIENGMLDEEKFKSFDKELREIVIESMDFAEKSPYPDPLSLEDGVFAP